MRVFSFSSATAMMIASPRPIGTVMIAINRVLTIERSSNSSCSCAVKFSNPTQVSSVRPFHEVNASTMLATNGRSTNTAMPTTCGPMKT